MNARLFFGCGLLLLLARSAWGDGAYQRTTDRTTLVWNPDVQADDAAAWSGGRDKERYATGEGTLTWYQIKRTRALGARVPEEYILVVRYSGKMVRGKLEGLVVAVDDKGRTSHANFVSGVRSDEWVDGSPSNSKPREAARSTKRAAASNSAAATPAPASKDREAGGEPNAIAESPRDEGVEKSASAETPKVDAPPKPKTAPETLSANKPAEKSAPAIDDRAKQRGSVEISTASSALIPSATTAPSPSVEKSVAAPTTSPSSSARSANTRRPTRRASDPSETLRSLSLPPQSLRNAAGFGGSLTSPSSSASESSPAPAATPSPSPAP